MIDENIAARIEQLVAQEHELRTHEATDRSDATRLEQDRRRLEGLEVELDLRWDLLRQRRALRDAGATYARDAAPVEGYVQ